MEEADEFKFTKKYYSITILNRSKSNHLEKFQDQGYQQSGEPGMINNEFQGIKITSMSTQSL
jgi:hypothetical protein